ncbi:hypothetical protein [sulfur-oxidizing endosymbiont of Gigantopelta aegis]|nr:hypothetical protein [sulfur-oxidizing endosymbiont of Gigantopelta aegis]
MPPITVVTHHYDEDHQAWLYNKASMHGIDNFLCRLDVDYHY